MRVARGGSRLLRRCTRHTLTEFPVRGRVHRRRARIGNFQPRTPRVRIVVASGGGAPGALPGRGRPFLRQVKKRILWLKSAIPRPLDQGTNFIALNLFRRLSAEYDIFYVALTGPGDAERAAVLRQYVSILEVPRSP